MVPIIQKPKYGADEEDDNEQAEREKFRQEIKELQSQIKTEPKKKKKAKSRKVKSPDDQSAVTQMEEGNEADNEAPGNAFMT